MESIIHAYYALQFEVNFLRLKGNSFQDFFSTIMEKCYPADFCRIKPWGSLGDKKNDGYLKSKMSLFQVYAPNELKLSDTLRKISEDFESSKPHWAKYVQIWTFVHNSRQGIAADVLKKLLELQEKNPNIKIEQWGFEELKSEFLKLNETEMASILGPAPSEQALTEIRFKDLQIVLEAISTKEITLDIEIKPVPQTKINDNHLSGSAEILIRAGMRKAKLVEDLFKKWTDPELGDRIANKFKDEYIKLKSLGLEPDIIFGELLSFAEQGNRSPKHRAAALSVIAYLFENCDIFEGK